MCDPGFAETAERAATTGWPFGDGADPGVDLGREQRCAPRSGASNGREPLVKRRRAHVRARLISNGPVSRRGWRWTPGRRRTGSRRLRSPRTPRADQRGRRRRRRSEGMRQISAGGDRRLDHGPSPGLVLDEPSLKRHAGARRRGRNAAAGPDRPEGWRATQPTATSSLARSPASCATLRGRELAGGRRRSGEQHDLRPPPTPALVALRLVGDQPGGLEVVEPPLHAAPVRADEPRTLRSPTRHGSPPHHRRQPDDELRDRRRVPRRPRRMTRAGTGSA